MKISALIKKSPVGKHFDKNTLNKIDEIFSIAVAKGIDSKLNEKVSAEKVKIKNEMIDIVDMYTDKIVKEKLSSVVENSAKVKLAEKIIESFKGAFGEMFITEGSSKMAKELEAKITEYNSMIDKIKADNKANLAMFREKYEKQINELKSKVKINESKVKVLNNKNMLEKAEKMIDNSAGLSAYGKSEAKKLVSEKMSRIGQDKLTSKHVENIVENLIAKTEKLKRLNKNKLNERSAAPSSTDSFVDEASKALDNM